MTIQNPSFAEHRSALEVLAPRRVTCRPLGRKPSRRPPVRRRAHQGFTLIEMLLALAICAIVLVAINGVFATAVRLRDKTSEAVENSIPTSRTFEIMERDLKCTVGPGGALAGDFRCGVQAVGATMGLSGEAGSAGLDFFTSTGIINDRAPWGDIQEVFYELKAPTDRNQRGMDLVRCVNRNILATTTQTPDIQSLMGGVQTLQFDCYDGVQWQPTWDTSTGNTNLPVAVRIRILPAAQSSSGTMQPLEMIVPLVTQTRTNSVSQ
jgi:general secretion pathway protein J